uniref:Uncharacterized protein n=2 Tax=Palpitomonas bilix TaxID=652834 RepID=A0A7S3G705_9EUKA|mmetsp:Transcript_31012/g.81432  ORF Transcript_31012/g.81432 Transcript_31012/m.81432 type:complete len:122 (+) Transcript_31012:836-1201(+)
MDQIFHRRRLAEMEAVCQGMADEGIVRGLVMLCYHAMDTEVKTRDTNMGVDLKAALASFRCMSAHLVMLAAKTKVGRESLKLCRTQLMHIDELRQRASFPPAMCSAWTAMMEAVLAKKEGS